MNRRNFVVSTAGAGFVSPVMPAAEVKRSLIELRWYRLRNMPVSQVQRTHEFLGSHYVPAAQRAGAGKIGAFGIVVGEESPSVLLAINYESPAAYLGVKEKLEADKEYQAALDAYSSNAAMPFMRMESSLLYSFKSVPQMEAPEPAATPRIFELRRYESSTLKSLRTKIEMFDEGEVDLFRKTGLIPIFFGETIIGPRMPNLTYMVAFDNMAAREKNWQAFGTSPEWKKMSSIPKYADAEVVSNISNAILRPLPFSNIK